MTSIVLEAYEFRNFSYRNETVGRKSRQMKGERRRNYDLSSLRAAVFKVKNENWSVYKASKEYGIPWTTLKTHVSNENEDSSTMDLPKLGRPFTFPKDIECKLVSYIIKMQEIGFGLTVTDIKHISYSLAVRTGQVHQFNDAKGKAGPYWWWSFKQRYNLSLRTPEKLAACRAVTANEENISDFYNKLLAVLTNLDIVNKPERVYNCDETGITFVVKPTKIVTQTGKKIIYSRTFAEKGVTQTVLGCCSASGTAVPPLIIFKGVRMVNDLSNGAPPNSIVRLSKNGWINTALFLEWLQHFVCQIPPARPVLLIMDSHASHVGIEVIDYAKENDIHLLTFPSHTSHLLQPLDVSVYKSLKNAWSKVMNDYKSAHPTSAPTRFDFCRLLTPAYNHAFQSSIIMNGFRKTGIMPFNRDAISSDSIAPSMIRPGLINTAVGGETNETAGRTSTPTISGERIPPSVVRPTSINPAMNDESNERAVRISTPGVCENEAAVAEVLSLPQITHSPGNKRALNRDPRARYLTPTLDENCDPNTEPTNDEARQSAAIPEPLAEILPNVQQQSAGPSRNKRSAKAGSGSAKRVAASSRAKNRVSATVSSPSTSSIRNKRPYSTKSTMCDVCGVHYSQDVALRNGAVWIECMECAKWYHQHCINCNSPQFLCENCDTAAFSGDDDDDWAPE